MAGKIIGSMDEVVANLKQAGGYAVKSVNDEMEIAMTWVHDEAVRRVPVEHGDMEKAIKLDSTLRKKWTVYIDPDASAVSAHGRQYTVGEYMNWLHEATYNLSALSAAKGPNVGPKFLENPFIEATGGDFLSKLQAKLEDAISKRR